MDLLTRFVHNIPWEQVISTVLRIAIVVALLWTAMAVAGMLLRRFERRLVALAAGRRDVAMEAQKRAETIARLLRQGVLIVIWVTGALIVLREIGIEIAPVLRERRRRQPRRRLRRAEPREGRDRRVLHDRREPGARRRRGPGERHRRAGRADQLPHPGAARPARHRPRLPERQREHALQPYPGMERIRVRHPRGLPRGRRSRDRSHTPGRRGDARRRLFRSAHHCRHGDLRRRRLRGIGHGRQGRLKTLPIRQWEVGREFRRRLKKAFDREGIRIPVPQRTLAFAQGEPLAALAAALGERAHAK